MHKEEKRRKFHEAILNKLYPPPPPKNDLDEEEELADLNLIKDGLEDDTSSLEEKLTSSGESECEQQQQKKKKKLTRAQRKRLRKKKLKEAASCRRNIIGPLLPEADGGDDLKDDKILNKDSTSEVQDLNSLLDKPGELSTTQKKLKHRRMAKKLKQNNVGSICHDEADSSLL